ncbi:aminoglycoside phosphotransferase family protein [Aestuariimicrobium ganziense]|uniref:aminoglycoside phosphotransferase family protein n=1 Tax=Aestuariimicrobium ganziense TaxID=2773677 RepID=UPI0019449484|nr:aminoglycoside phosphotransferase family protein [Aestuariimicrobium ganziense]
MNDLIPDGFGEHVRWQYVDESSRTWFEDLPETIEAVLADWGLVVDGSSRFGAEGIAVPVRRGDEALVVKFQQATPEFAQQAQALDDWDGRGMVRLHEADLVRGALLLERLDASLHLTDEPIEVALAEAAALLRREAVEPVAGHRYPLTRDLVTDLSRELDERNEAVARPIDESTVAAIRRACDWLLEGDDPGLMVNADLHHEQVMPRMDGGEWTAVDPRPMVGDPAHQCPQLLWSLEDRLPTDSSEIRQNLALVAAHAGFEPERARSWTLVRGADYWLWGLANGLTWDPERCRRIIAAVLER